MRPGLSTRALVACALAAAAARPAVAKARPVPDEKARRVDALFQNLNTRPGPGMAIVVVRDGKVILRRGYGFASIEHRAPITPATVFDVASISKQFTGLAVAMLVSEGKIALADDVRRYVPEMPDFGRPITIGHLVHHTSGLRDWPGTLYVAGRRFDDAITFPQILSMAFAQRTLNFAPGAEHLYSNTGYNVLAEMIRRVTGRPFRTWMDDRIFAPLGMAHTRFREDVAEVIADRAYGYHRRDDGTLEATPDYLAAPGSSSLFSTADDLGRWLINFGTARVGGAGAIALMRTPGPLGDGTTTPYGFGILNGSYRGKAMFTHSGGWASFNSYLVYFPELKLGIAVLANGDDPDLDAQKAVIEVGDIYLPDDLPPKPPPAAERPIIAIPSALLSEYEGLYRMRAGSYVRISRDGARLRVRATGGKEAIVSPRSETDFESSDGAIAIAFRRDAAGRVSLDCGGSSAPRVDGSPVGRPENLADYAGNYESSELRASYRVALENGALSLRQQFRTPLALARLWRDDFGTSDTYLASIEFVRGESGRVTGFVVNGDPRNRDIRFSKR